ncbi:type II toxin-antitoxin system RelE/ParE family toxin [Burkholderia gladioli]|uniref:Plasmid stabilization system n=1 Tax=Burkholderia gladioli (strain BSR3) TaxID=999541 RepID=F2LTC3_BURGS|nr:type II toxin-antitoxin system RelE/ParE family toxin [Burkholderia gladioli]AEA66069.1 plasmid stabilization system [Burkholderia gladioli BSR3]MBW5285108.1 type II toxin-antitoxin system RelE/ParE family toxin [Burkholderia gladioli]
MGVKAQAVRLTSQAEADLEAIWFCMIDSGTGLQSERDISELVAALEGLAHGQSPGRPGGSLDEYCRVLVGSYEVFYRESTTTLDVIRVLNHGIDVDPPL